MGGGDSVVSIIVSILMIAFCVLSIAGTWRVFAKAGEHGWACLVPFYGNYVLYRIVFDNGWLFLLMFVPLVGMIMALVANFRLGKVFGKSTGFCIGLIFLAPIFMLLLGFSDSEYIG